MAHKGEGGEGGWVQLLELVAFQLQQPQGGEALEGVWVDELQSVVVQVQPGQGPESLKGVSVDLLQFVVAHLQHLNQGATRRKEISMSIENIYKYIYIIN